MAVRVERLNQGVVSPLVTHVERGGDRTPVGVLTAGVEDVLVQPLVQVVDRVVESEDNNLRSSLGREVGRVFRPAALTVRQLTLAGLTLPRSLLQLMRCLWGRLMGVW